jgi:hypothetical protein
MVELVGDWDPFPPRLTWQPFYQDHMPFWCVRHVTVAEFVWSS